MNPRILLSTIAIEPNRWSSGRISAVHGLDWIRRTVEDGFDGIELWENHYFDADDRDRKV